MSKAHKTPEATEEGATGLPSWIAEACTRCGKCCLDEHYMLTLSATREDVERWEEEWRYDILEYVAPVGPPDLGQFDLWVKDGREHCRCPFVRKDRGKPTYHCQIYETRPEACRGYPYNIEQMVNIKCEIVDILQDLGNRIALVSK